MSESDPRADAPPMYESYESDVGVSELPTGTVTLLLADVEGSTRLWETQPEEMTRRRRATRSRTGRPGRRPWRCAAGRAGRGRQLRRRVRPRQRRGGVRPGPAAGTAGADPAAHRCAHRRGAVARRGQLHRADHQQDRTPARFGARRPDRAVRCDRRDLSPTDLPRRRLAARSGQPPAARSSPRPSGSSQLCHPDLRNEFPPLRLPAVLSEAAFRPS